MNKALLNSATIIGGSFGKSVGLNELTTFFPEFFERGADKTPEHLYRAVTWIYRATHIRANGLQGLPYKVLRGESEIFDSQTDEQEFFPDTDLDWLIWRSQADRMLFGASYWEKLNNFIEPGNLRRLNPLTMEVLGDPVRGIVGFRQRIAGQAVVWRPEEIVYQPLWSPDDDINPGVSPAQVATVAGGLNENSLQYASNFFEHGAIPPVILTTEQNLPDQEIERVRTTWQRLYGSVRNAWRTAILRQGLKPTPIGQRTKDLAIPDLHDVVRAEIAAAFGMSVTFLEGKAANRATDEQETLKFVTGTLMPDATLFQSGMNRQLWEPMGLRWKYQFNEVEAIQKNEAEKAAGTAELLGKAIETQASGLISFEQGVWVVGELYSQMGMAFPEGLAKPEEPEEPEPMLLATPGAPGQPRTRPEPLQPSAERMWEDLRRWRKVVKRLGPEKALARGFETDVIPEGTQQHIRMYLELADTTEEALEVFDEPFR